MQEAPFSDGSCQFEARTWKIFSVLNILDFFFLGGGGRRSLRLSQSCKKEEFAKIESRSFTK